jgi:hypothetical protein
LLIASLQLGQPTAVDASLSAKHFASYSGLEPFLPQLVYGHGSFEKILFFLLRNGEISAGNDLK